MNTNQLKDRLLTIHSMLVDVEEELLELIDAEVVPEVAEPPTRMGSSDYPADLLREQYIREFLESGVEVNDSEFRREFEAAVPNLIVFRNTGDITGPLIRQATEMTSRDWFRTVLIGGNIGVVLKAMGGTPCYVIPDVGPRSDGQEFAIKDYKRFMRREAKRIVDELDSPQR